MQPDNRTPDLNLDYPQLNSTDLPEYTFPAFVSTYLEDAAIRHCLLGDVVARCLGYPVVVNRIFAAVDDPQLNDAAAALRSKGFFDYDTKQQDEYRLCTKEWPGFTLSIFPEVESPILVNLVPASFWYLHLEPENFRKHTVHFTQPGFRLPNKVQYFDAMISLYAHCLPQPDLNLDTSYIRYQFAIVKMYMKPLLHLLSPEDEMFVDLIDKVMQPKTRDKVCLEWQKIRRGETTVAEARRRIPRKDLKFAKYKAEVDERLKRKAEEHKAEETLSNAQTDCHNPRE